MQSIKIKRAILPDYCTEDQTGTEWTACWNARTLINAAPGQAPSFNFLQGEFLFTAEFSQL
jgi:hypothetical protein